MRSKGLPLKRFHTQPGIDPLDEISYERRASRITNPDGSVVFEEKNSEIPRGWSQLAADIAVSKYFRKTGVPRGSGKKSPKGAESSVRQLVVRIVRTIREHGEKNGYFAGPDDAETFEAELSFLLITQRGAFNSPVWFNVGLFHRYGILGSGGSFFFNEKKKTVEETTDAYSHPQSSACFIQSVSDDLSSIFELAKNEARIFKYGSGTGSNFSRIRGSMEQLAGGGHSSGLMSFLEVLDRGAGATKSGGTTRRAAKMVCLDVDHPEILSFIDWKINEEKKAAALIAAGYSPDLNGEAYRTVSGQNSNNSVRLSDKFMKRVLQGKSWETRLRTNGQIHESLPARKLFGEIAHAAWFCADPGVQFDTTINEWHTCPATDRIYGSNPCSEYMFLDDSACNLASINLLKYSNEDGSFELEGFRHACKIFILAQEILVGLSSYPTKKIAENSHAYRPLGLGYANLGALLMANGIPYDSESARAWCGAITAIMHGEAYSTSAEIAKVKGAFSGYKKNRQHMLKVLKRHQRAANSISRDCPAALLKAAKESLSRALNLGNKSGYRNAQVTALAPTGTIGLLMDCDTTGIEPDFALVKFKKLAGGGYFKIVNQSVPRALKRLGYAWPEIQEIVRYVIGTLTLEGAPWINKKILLEKGLNEKDLQAIEDALPRSFDIFQAFHRSNLSENTVKRLQLSSEATAKADFQLLRWLGFSDAQIEEANEHVCGRLNMEGCPILKPEHLPVFDCASKSGKGKRYLDPMSHLKMMAAAQPFLSGAISKTVNLPNHANEQDIAEIFLQGWKLGLKAIAVYRDGSKSSQPLSTQTGAKKWDLEKAAPEKEISKLEPAELEALIEMALERAGELGVIPPLKRHPLPIKRGGFTLESSVGGQKVYLRTGEYSNGRLGELFIDVQKENPAFRSLLSCLAIAISKGLQYGVPLEEFVDTFLFTRFEPNGMVQHENIKQAASVVDFVFRVLGMEYLGRTDFVHVKPDKLKRAPDKIRNSRAEYTGGVAKNSAKTPQNEPDAPDRFYANLMKDAPDCPMCGHIAVRDGACYRCMNCGHSMGCS